MTGLLIYACGVFVTMFAWFLFEHVLDNAGGNTVGFGILFGLMWPFVAVFLALALPVFLAYALAFAVAAGLRRLAKKGGGR